jgi:hypothetical protein
MSKNIKKDYKLNKFLLYIGYILSGSSAIIFVVLKSIIYGLGELILFILCVIMFYINETKVKGMIK